MFEILSDEKLMEIAKVPPEDYGAPPYWWLRANQRVAQASLKDALRQFVEWLRKHNQFPYDSVTLKKMAPDGSEGLGLTAEDYQALRAELKK